LGSHEGSGHCRSGAVPRCNGPAAPDRAGSIRAGTVWHHRGRSTGRDPDRARRHSGDHVLGARAAGAARLGFPASQRDNEGRIAGILIPTASGGHVPLREVARIERNLGKANITREANSRMLALKFNIEGRDLGSVVTDASAAVKRDVKVPEGSYLVWGGE